MLPVSSVRRRIGSVSVVEGMNRLSSMMNNSARKYKKLPLVGKIVFFSTLLFSVTLYGFLFRYLMRPDISDDNFLEVNMCPACFGSSGCGLLYHDQVQLSGWSSYNFIDLFSTKNIRYGLLTGNQKVVLKKLGSTSEIQELDHKICKDANRPPDCDVPRVLYLTDTAQNFRKDPLLPKHLNQSAGMFTCASYRLMDRMWARYKEMRKKKNILFGDKLQVWYTATLNPEPLLLQTFPASERWPFPEYFGACGRHIIVEHVGRTLQEFYSEPFHKRAGVALELMMIAEHLTNNNEDFALYLADPNWENFGVDASGKVRILDAENIIVVDRLAIGAKKARGYDTFLQSEHIECPDHSNCLTMFPDDLCTHLHSDHNHYVICTNFLDPYINDGIMPGGLLHDMPEEAKDYWDLELLLKECARPTKFKGRLSAKHKLISALRKLHDQSSEHLEPPPKIDEEGVRKPKPKKELWEYEDYDDPVVAHNEVLKESGGNGKKEEKGIANEDNIKEKGNANEDNMKEEMGKGAVVVE